MALVLKSKSKPAEPVQQAAQVPQQETKKFSSAPKPTAPTPSFLKTGQQAKEAFEKEETKAQISKDRPFRFFLKNGGESQITFLDGDLDADGVLSLPFFYEHFERIGGRPQTFVCVMDEEPCPICEGGSQPSFVGALTVIDHSTYEGKDGKVYKDQVRLFVPKRGTIKQLQKLAEKRGGLRGCRFDVSRTGDKEPAVGNVFDFTEKLTEAQLVATYGEKSKALDYSVAPGYLPASELRKLGFGTMHAPVGQEPGAGADFNNQL